MEILLIETKTIEVGKYYKVNTNIWLGMKIDLYLELHNGHSIIFTYCIVDGMNIVH